MKSDRLKEKIKEGFNQWITSLDKKRENREALRQNVCLQARILLKREDLRTSDRQHIEMILRIVE